MKIIKEISKKTNLIINILMSIISFCLLVYFLINIQTKERIICILIILTFLLYLNILRRNMKNNVSNKNILKENEKKNIFFEFLENDDSKTFKEYLEKLQCNLIYDSLQFENMKIINESKFINIDILKTGLILNNQIQKLFNTRLNIKFINNQKQEIEELIILNNEFEIHINNKKIFMLETRTKNIENDLNKIL